MPEPIIFQRPKYNDSRGYFEESWNYKFLNKKDILEKFVQQNNNDEIIRYRLSDSAYSWNNPKISIIYLDNSKYFTEFDILGKVL